MKAFRFPIVLLLVLIVTTLFSPPAHAYEFCVSDASQLQAALSTATTNGEDNTIRIVQGTYVGHFVYLSTQPSSLTILGGYTASCASRTIEPENTVLDGQNTGHVLTIGDTSTTDIALTIEGVTFQNGISTGVSLNSGKGSVVIRNNVIRENVGTYGGGMQVSGFAFVSVLGNFFLTNGANGYGGGLRIDGNGQVEVMIMENVFSGNNVTAYGGGGLVVGIEASAPLVSIVNNLFANNSSPWGGGALIDVPGGATRIVNNTIAGNLTPGCGGGMTVVYVNEATITNNIFWNNAGGSGSDLCLSVPVVSMIANDFDQSAAGVSGLSGFVFDPSNLNKLDPLFVDQGNEDFHLQATSPCIDSGNLAVVPLRDTDIESFPRVVNAAIDMGAYEYQGTLIPSKPDLFGLLNEFHYFKADERVSTVFEIRNRGTKSGEITAECYVSPIAATLGTLVDSVRLKRGLASSASRAVTYAFSSAEPLSGKYLQLVIDPNDIVWESVETNNRVIVRIP